MAKAKPKFGKFKTAESIQLFLGILRLSDRWFDPQLVRETLGALGLVSPEQIAHFKKDLSDEDIFNMTADGHPDARAAWTVRSRSERFHVSDAEWSKKVKAVRRERAKRRPETAKNYKTVLGRNIDRLRQECGLSFDGLARKTGISKHLILNHVNKGTTPNPENKDIYAKTFSHLLGREITIPDLTSSIAPK